MRNFALEKIHIQNTSIDTRPIFNDADSPKEVGSLNENQFEFIDFSNRFFRCPTASLALSLQPCKLFPTRSGKDVFFDPDRRSVEWILYTEVTKGMKGTERN